MVIKVGFIGDVSGGIDPRLIMLLHQAAGRINHTIEIVDTTKEKAELVFDETPSAAEQFMLDQICKPIVSDSRCGEHTGRGKGDRRRRKKERGW